MNKWAGLLLLLSLPATADDTWLVGTVRSYHIERKDYNEANYGIGVETKSWMAGTYVNSYDRQTVYGGILLPLADIGPAHIRYCICAFTGYKEQTGLAVTPVPLPVIAFEGRDWGVNIIVTPVVFALQVKRRF